MSRRLKNWIRSYLDYAGVTEAPKIMHFFCGVSAIAGALRRKVWIDQKRFQWTPSFYVILVAPPGIIAKSTTIDIAMDLLKQVPGIKFGPDIITWQALATAFAESTESFSFADEWLPMSPLTLVASELGNLINPQDRDMVNLYITLWDGRRSLQKVTKGSGSDTIEAPWINMLGATTPHWIADNMPSATVGGGFTSRCIFVYADRKERFVAYVDEAVTSADPDKRADLIHDLEHISLNICGPYDLSLEARKWGKAWYEDLWNNRPKDLEDDRLDGYIARKQTHLHKLALVLAASERDEQVILEDDLALANQMLLTVESDLGKVFSRIGRTEDSLQADRFIQFVRRRGECRYAEAYRHIHAYFPDFRDFEGMVTGAIRSGYVEVAPRGPSKEIWIVYTGPAQQENGVPKVG